jgi:hypothetical protein
MVRIYLIIVWFVAISNCFPRQWMCLYIGKGPDCTPNELDDLLERKDLSFTICEMLKLGVPLTIAGTSLLPLIAQREKVNDYAYSEHMRLLQRMVASKEWLYIFSDQQQKEWHGLKFEERYLMRRENENKSELSHQFAEVCNEMENIARMTAGSVTAELEDRSEELEEWLQALGYL